jgi:hypothetical protein
MLQFYRKHKSGEKKKQREFHDILDLKKLEIYLRGFHNFPIQVFHYLKIKHNINNTIFFFFYIQSFFSHIKY